MQFPITAAAQTTTSKILAVTRNKFTNPTFSFYLHTISGTAPTNVKLQASPDEETLADASSRWADVPTSTIVPGVMITLTFCARKIRAVSTGGDGTTNALAELV